jgi:hypothetical protein
MQIKEAEVNEIIHMQLGWKKIPYEDENATINKECSSGWAWESPTGIIYAGVKSNVPEYVDDRNKIIDVLKTLNKEQFVKFINFIKPNEPNIWSISDLMQLAFFIEPMDIAKGYLSVFDIKVIDG